MADIVLLTPAQVAMRLQVHPRTVLEWLREGRLPGVRIGRRGLWRIRESDFDLWIARGVSTAATDAAPARAQSATPRKPIWERFAEVASQIPEDERSRMPRDGAEQHDHYLYGWPKRAP